MKQIFDKHTDHLSPDEKREIWSTLRSSQRTTRFTSLRRLWAYPVAGALVTAILLIVLLRHQSESPFLGSPKSRPTTEYDGSPGPTGEPSLDQSGANVAKITRGPVDAPEHSREDLEAGSRAATPAAPAGAVRSPHSGADQSTVAGPGQPSATEPAQPTPAAPGSAAALSINRPQRADLPVSLSFAERQTDPSVSGGGEPRRAERGAAAGPQQPSVASSSETPQPMATQRAARDEQDVVAEKSAGEGPERSLSSGAGSGEFTVSSPVQSSRVMDARALGRAASGTAVGVAQGLGTIEGVVEDSTGNPLAYANVILEGTSLGAFSRENGNFKIANVPTGIYAVKVSMVGYADRRIESVRVEMGRSTNLRVRLALEPVRSIDEVQIIARRESIRLQPGGIGHSSGGSQAVLPSPSNELKDIVGLKGGGIASSDQLHIRGGRSAESNFQSERHAGTSSVLGVLPRSTPPLSAPPPVLPTTGGSTLPNDEVYDSMFFKHYGVNPFIATDEDSFSTFAVDVDAASYTVARKYIELGHLPPPEAVRVEEFVNFFPQDYPRFEGPDFRIFLEGAPSPFGPGYHLIRVGLKAREISAENRKPANLVFVIDTSGSMEREDRLELVKRALRILVDQLRADDRIGIVVFGTQARVLLTPATLREKVDILDAIDRLHPDGSTNAEAGLRLGYEMADGIRRSGWINRVILCSDGVANEGRTGPESILAEIKRAAGQGIQLTTIGFGMGNYNDVLMEQLADQGDGNYYYVDDLEEARRVLQGNLTGTLQTIARDAKVQVEFDSRSVVRYRLLGFENRDVADRDFRNDSVDAGEIGAGHEVTALYEIKLAKGVGSGRLATVRLRYAPAEDKEDREHREDRENREHRESRGDEDRGRTRVREIEQGFDVVDLVPRVDRASASFRLDAAVAEFAEILRGSFWAKESRIADILPLARDAADELRAEPAAREFLNLLERASGLSEKLSPEERRRTIDRWVDEPDPEYPPIEGPRRPHHPEEPRPR